MPFVHSTLVPYDLAINHPNKYSMPELSVKKTARFKSSELLYNGSFHQKGQVKVYHLSKKVSNFAKLVPHNDGQVLFIKTDPLCIIAKTQDSSIVKTAKLKSSLKDQLFSLDKKEFFKHKIIKKVLSAFEEKLVPAKDWIKKISHNGGNLLVLKDINPTFYDNPCTTDFCILFQDRNTKSVYINSYEHYNPTFWNANETRWEYAWKFDAETFRHFIAWQLYVYLGHASEEDAKNNFFLPKLRFLLGIQYISDPIKWKTRFDSAREFYEKTHGSLEEFFEEERRIREKV